MTAVQVQAFPASYAQSRLWFLHQLEPELTAYHMPRVWRLQGALEVKALQSALAGLIERHTTLRTSFRLHGGEVLQLIHPPGEFVLAVEELGERDRAEVLAQWLEQERSTPFDLTSGVLLRARLLQVAHQEHVLLVNHHHIASDGWSQSVLAHDLTEQYNAHCSDRASTLAPLRVHYHDYATWQRQRLSGDRLQILKNYWIPQLTGLEPLDLPTDHPRPGTPSHRGASVSFQITPELLAPFEELCRLEGATLQMGLLALLALLLHRTSRQDDFAIGIPIWGRSHPDLEPLIGFFINTLPIRTRFKPHQTFRQLLQQVKASSLAAYDHQELPFEQIVEALNLPRDTSRNPLVQVMLQLIELPEASLHNLDGLTVETIPAKSESSKLDLSLYLRRSADHGLQGSLCYATDLFSSDRMERFCSHLLTLLSSALKAPDSPANSLCLLPDSERQLIESWQHGPSIDVPDLCVHQLFEQQVERTPDAIALIFQDQQLTYQELNARANQLAHQLIDLGVGPEVVVAVCLERSVELIVSLLAILKAGGAYLPIDPSWPGQRLQHLLAQTKSKLAISREPVGIGAQAQDSFHAINPAIEKTKYAKSSTLKNPTIKHLSQDSLAYIVFSSGSTGLPKGIEVTHRVTTLKCLSVCKQWSLSAGTRTLALSSAGFDIFLRETLFPLTSGGTSVLVGEDTRKSPRELVKTVQRLQVSRIQATPSYWDELAAFEIHKAKSMQVIAIGETLNPKTARQLCLPGQTSLLHLYGTTEAPGSTGILYRKGEWIDQVPIGKPLDHSIIRILNNELLLCPIGVPGELHIGGAGLARGYLNNPELTAEKFIPDPFSTDPTARLYKSGDLASWNPDGTLSFHGRIDQQIKLRGFRIEPGEIEANLLSHPAISQAVVLLRHVDPSTPRLVAYWVADASQPSLASTSSEQLHAFLADRLPDYMVPAAFLQLEALPITPNGKLDRKALPAPSFSGNLEQRVAPSTDLERQLHSIWAEVLGHSDFGITDNFFAIGGHSLLTMRIGQLVQNRLDLDLPVYLYFSHPTIRDLACKLCDGHSGSVSGGDTCPDHDRGLALNTLPPPVQRALVQQQIFLERWPGELAAGHQFVRMLGERKSAYRLFWCFQGSHEHESLARHLAPEVSIYGMRSLYATDDAKVIYQTPALLAIPAGLYVREVISLSGDKAPLVVGGNCQAAKVVHAMAQQLVGCGCTVGRLLLMELRMLELEKGRFNWDGPVTLIWGRDSSHNPFSSAHRPSSRRLRMLKRLAPWAYRALIRSRLKRAFTGALDIAIVPGVHGAFFRSENIQGLAEVVKGCVLNLA